MSRVSATALSRRQTHCLAFFFQAGSELSLSPKHIREFTLRILKLLRSQDILLYTRCILSYSIENRTGLTTENCCRWFKCIFSCLRSCSRTKQFLRLEMKSLLICMHLDVIWDFLQRHFLQLTGVWADCFGHSRPPNCIQHSSMRRRFRPYKRLLLYTAP